MKPRFMKRLILLLALLGIGGLLFWLLLPAFVSTDFVRSAIEREITQAAGQRVSIGSTTDIDLFPVASARLNDVVIRPAFQPAGTNNAEPLATIATIDVEMTLGSIFAGRPEISSLHLLEPEINLSFAPDRNLLSQLPLRNVVTAVTVARRQRDEQRAAQAAQSATAPAEPVETAINYPDWLEMRVGTVTFENASVMFTRSDDPADDVVRISEATGQLSWPRLDLPLALTSTFAWNGETVELSYRTDNPVDALAGEISDAALTAVSGPGTLRFSGSAGLAAGFYAFGGVEFETQSLRDLLRWRGDDVRPALALGKIMLSAEMQAREGAVRLDELQLNLDGNAGTGVIEVRDGGDKPVTLIGTLDFPSLDLADFFGAFVQLPASPTERLPIDTRFMDQFQTDLRVSAATATFGNAEMQNVAATAQTTTDIALFDLGDATAFGGTLQARIRLDRSRQQPKSELSIAGQGIEMDQAKTAMGLAPILPEGIADFSYDLSSPLTDWSALLSRPDGRMMLRMGAGRIPGLDPSMLEDIDAAGEFRPLELGGANSAPFEALLLETAINNGELRLDGFQIDYGEDRLDFSGVVQLASRSLALTLTDMRQQADGDMVSQKRFFVGGGLDVPYVYPMIGPPALEPADR